MGKDPEPPSGFTIDPHDFIHPPFQSCPDCDSEDFGVLSIAEHRVTRRCLSCGHTESEQLAAVDRKVIYLDQMAISNMVKALDPEAGERREIDPYWTDLFERLDTLVKLQRVACPPSTTHERESLVAPNFKLYRRMYDHFSAGVKFRYPEEVHRIQLHHALKAWHQDREPDFTQMDREQILLGGTLDGWMERFQISVNFGTRPGRVQDLRQDRDRRHQALYAYMSKARESENMGFEDWYHDARGAHPRVLVQLFKRRITAFSRAQQTGQITEEIWNPPIASETLLQLSKDLERMGVSEEKALEKALEFIQSDAAMDAPYNTIYALLMAALATKAAAGQKKVGRGTSNDLDLLSTVLPYVDAIYTDDQFAGLLQEEPVSTRLPSDALVFSNRTRREFLDYLDQLREEIPTVHKGRVTEVYGERWLKPYVGMIADERRRHLYRDGGTT